MGLKEELKRDMRNLMKDIDKEVSKTWKIDYKGHSIEIINKMNEEILLIDGKIVSQNKRKSLLSHIRPYAKLSGILTLNDGKKEKVFVKIGGFTKLNCIVKVGNKTIFEQSQKLEFLPWENKEKIVPYILQQVESHHKILDDSLPDDRYFYDKDEPRLQAGLADYIADDLPTPFFTKKLIKLFEKQVKNPNEKTRKATYEHLLFDNIASYGHQFIKLFQEVQLDKSLVQQEAIWMLENACHREVVKFSLVALSFTSCENYKEKLLKIGMHEEFTLYVIFALKKGTTNANESIWKLAQTVSGWGKIEAVRQLTVTTPEMKHWILTKGCENRIDNGYLALTCALKGKLDIELYEESISKEIYEGASIIIEGLLQNEVHTIDAYPYAEAVLSRFVYHSKIHCSKLEHVRLLNKIYEFIHGDEEEWEERFNNGWKRHERQAMSEMLSIMLENKKISQSCEDISQTEDLISQTDEEISQTKKSGLLDR